MTEKSLDSQLIDAMTQFVYDPLGFVYFAYPWKKPGLLLNEEGPDKWQQEVLIELGDLLRCQAAPDLLWTGRKPEGEKIGNTIRYAIKAGRDPGKTTLIAWIIHFWASTRPNCQGIVLANTKTQLETKTWRELAKWWGMSVHQHWFEHNAAKFVNLANQKVWYITPIIWSKDNPQAVAGTHEDYVLIVFDESSHIDDGIWETIGSGLTDPHVLWLAVGNPVRTEGYFKNCFDDGKFAHRWIQRTVDSRDAKRPNKEEIQAFIDDYGEDSDYVRVWVKGLFPRVSLDRFISDYIIEMAVARKHDPVKYATYPKVLGVDLARHGDDRNAMVLRQGWVVHEITVIRDKIENLMIMVSYINQKINEWHPKAVFIDTGMGYGVIDRLRELGHRNIFEVNFGEKAVNEREYANKRSEIWGEMKKWLIEDGSIPDNVELREDLSGPMYGFDARQRIQLERAKDMKGRGVKSPDIATALGCTFSMRLPFEMREERTEAQKIIDEVEGKTTEYGYFSGGDTRNQSYLKESVYG